jgi:hypothetical protein
MGHGFDQNTLMALPILDHLGALRWPATCLAAISLLLASYATYQLLFHPLAHVPGPRIAALTNLWKVYQIYGMQLHELLLELHEQHGPVVRIGPNDVHIQDTEAVVTIYKGGRAFPKTSYYNSWQAFNHNVFGTQDEDVCKRAVDVL